MSATFWAVLPPIIAIALALITKEVYSSLLIGIFAGARRGEWLPCVISSFLMQSRICR